MKQKKIKESVHISSPVSNYTGRKVRKCKHCGNYEFFYQPFAAGWVCKKCTHLYNEGASANVQARKQINFDNIWD